MPFQISKQFTFSASHQLDHLPADHQCARLHGHNYTVEVVLESDQLNELQFVVDYGRLDSFKRHLDQWFDHHHLNEVMGSGQLTTAENLAIWFFLWMRLRFHQTVEVRVSETAKTWASYRSPNFVPTNDKLVGVWTKVNKDLYNTLHPTLADYAQEEAEYQSFKQFKLIHQGDPIKTDTVSDLERSMMGEYIRRNWKQIETAKQYLRGAFPSSRFYIDEHKDEQGISHWLLVCYEDKQVWFAGVAIGHIHDVVAEHLALMPTNQLDAWRQGMRRDIWTAALMPTLEQVKANRSNLETRKQGFQVIKLDNDRGDIRYALVTQDTHVYFRGSYLGELDDVIKTEWNSLDDTEKAAWENLPKFSLYAAGHKPGDDEPRIIHGGRYA